MSILNPLNVKSSPVKIVHILDAPFYVYLLAQVSAQQS